MDRGDLRFWTAGRFRDKMQKLPWNANIHEFSMSPVSLAVHGTDADVARKIIQNGFSVLSVADAGYYGTGIYFTTSVNYALPYFALRSSPSLLICLVTPGTAFPVVEHRNEPASLFGSPLRTGYQSHYVTVTASGDPCISIASNTPYGPFDEIVVAQESQVLPFYLVEFDKLILGQFAVEFQSKLKAPLPDVAKRAEFKF